MKFPRTALLLASLTIVGLTVPAYASGAPVWQNARGLSLPAGSTSVANGYLPYLACPSAGNCVAGGASNSAAGNSQGLLLNEVGGVWRSPTTIVAPANAVAKYGVTLSGLACGAVGRCSAVGTYFNAAFNQLSFIADEVGTRWNIAREVVLPANASPSSQSGGIHSIACTSAGDCSAVGTYVVGTGPSIQSEGFVVDEVNGAWSNATEVRLPVLTTANPYVTLDQVACAGTGYCSAVGSFIDTSNVTHAIVVNQVARTWHAAAILALPANASAFAGATASEVTCISAGNCSATGTYNAAGSGVQALVANETNGAWSRAKELQMPANAAANPQALLFGFQGITCASVGNCTTGGQYIDKTGNFQGFLANEVNARWQAATQLNLPAGATQASHNGGVVSVSCTSPGTCSAGAAYLDSAGDYQAMIATETNNTWGAGAKLVLPPASSGVGIGGGVYALVCQRNASCEAIGSYLNSASNYEAFATSAP